MQVERITRMGKRHRVGGDLIARHAVQVHRHRPGSGLVVGDVARGVALDEVLDFRFGEGFAIPLLLDDLDSIHVYGSARCYSGIRGERQVSSAQHKDTPNGVLFSSAGSQPPGWWYR